MHFNMLFQNTDVDFIHFVKSSLTIVRDHKQRGGLAQSLEQYKSFLCSALLNTLLYSLLVLYSFR